jgi:hypothetical protein
MAYSVCLRMAKAELDMLRLGVDIVGYRNRKTGAVAGPDLALQERGMQIMDP